MYCMTRSRTALMLTALLLPVACGDDSDTSETTVSMTSAAETGAETDNETETPTSGGSGMADTGGSGGGSTGPGMEVCDTCDPATEYCHESIIDGPSEFSCRPIPEECAEDVTCTCIQDIACPESLQGCQAGPPIVVECVEG